jgi:threonine dehydratase
VTLLQKRQKKTVRPAASHPTMPQDYLKKILTARVYDVARESALDLAPKLSKAINNTVLLKREDMQEVFSFKLRGAYNKMAHLSAAELKHKVWRSRRSV